MKTCNRSERKTLEAIGTDRLCVSFTFVSLSPSLFPLSSSLLGREAPPSSMLDAVVAFTRGGEVLWRWKGGSSKHGSAAASTNAPLDALVRSCLLEDRASEASFAWDAPGVGGGAYTLKWSLHNVSA